VVFYETPRESGDVGFSAERTLYLTVGYVVQRSPKVFNSTAARPPVNCLINYAVVCLDSGVNRLGNFCCVVSVQHANWPIQFY
jgi:hypothetical protein